MSITRLMCENTNINDANFKFALKIKKLKKKMFHSENIKVIWQMKDKIKEYEHKILINQQQVRFNLMVITTTNDRGI